MSSFRWKGGWPGSSKSIMVFNLFTVWYDNPRVCTTFNYDLVT
jgi:hypothetical protein